MDHSRALVKMSPPFTTTTIPLLLVLLLVVHTSVSLGAAISSTAHDGSEAKAVVAAAAAGADRDVARPIQSVQSRDLEENIARDNSSAECRNGGILEDGVCVCRLPHVGPTCQDFACVNGISAGARYDPNSLMFWNPCLCDKGWSGILCDERQDTMCSDHGEFVNGTCRCNGEFFGSHCQYTKRCDEGEIKNGRCICRTGWEGDYCEQIVCAHGYPDTKNGGKRCVCPLQYMGTHCDNCSQSGPHLQPYPICVVDFIGHERRYKALAVRRHSEQERNKRSLVLAVAIFALTMIAIFMAACHWWLNRTKNEAIESIRVRETATRKAELAVALLGNHDSQTDSNATGSQSSEEMAALVLKSAPVDRQIDVKRRSTQSCH